MPTTGGLSRYWSTKTSGNDVEVVVPAEPTEMDILRLDAFFAEVMQQLRADRGS